MNAITTISPEPTLPPATSLSLSLPAATTFDEWQHIGRELAARDKVLNWWIGDWWAFGEHSYGDRADAAASAIFPLTYGTLRNYGSVCRSIETSRRRDNLDWSHHQEIAPLARQSSEAAEMLLDRAERENLTVSQVRAAVRVLQGKTVSQVLDARDEDPEHYYLLTIARAWNRAPVEVRREFLELAGEADLGDIDP